MRRGVTFEAAGKSQALRFDVNAICELESAFDCGTDEIAARLGGDGRVPRIGDLRQAFRVGLGGDLTLQEAGEVMAEVGLKRAAELLGEAMGLAFRADAAPAGDAPGKAKAAA